MAEHQAAGTGMEKTSSPLQSHASRSCQRVLILVQSAVEGGGGKLSKIPATQLYNTTEPQSHAPPATLTLQHQIRNTLLLFINEQLCILTI